MGSYRHSRYNRSAKGRARNAVRESSAARRAYKAAWARGQRQRRTIHQDQPHQPAHIERVIVYDPDYTPGE